MVSGPLSARPTRSARWRHRTSRASRAGCCMSTAPPDGMQRTCMSAVRMRSHACRRARGALCVCGRDWWASGHEAGLGATAGRTRSMGRTPPIHARAGLVDSQAALRAVSLPRIRHRRRPPRLPTGPPCRQLGARRGPRRVLWMSLPGDRHTFYQHENPIEETCVRV